MELCEHIARPKVEPDTKVKFGKNKLLFTIKDPLRIKPFEILDKDICDRL
jgi:hypothetical protein